MKKAMQFLAAMMCLVLVGSFAYQGKHIIWPQVNAQEKTEENGAEKQEKEKITYSCEFGKKTGNSVNLTLQNVTGKTFTSVSLKESGAKKWGKNLLPKGKTFASEAYAEAYLDKANKEGKATTYDFQLKYKEGKKTKTLMLHNLEPGTSPTIQIYMLEDIAYVKYINNGKMVNVTKLNELAQNTKDKAVATKKRKDEEKRKKAEEKKRKAAAEAAARVASQQAAQNNSYSNSGASSGASSGGSSSSKKKSSKPHVVSKSPSCNGSGYDKVWSDGRTSHSGSNGKDVFD